MMLRKTFSRSIKKLARPLMIALGIATIFALLLSGSMRKASATGNQGDTPQTVFTNATPITINDASTATPYPSTIAASGLPTSIPVTPGSVQVTLNSYSHTFSDDVAMVLVGPTGAALLIQDGAGDDPDMVNVTYTLSDTGATVLPGTTAWTAGTYKPSTYYVNDSFPAPGPGTTYGSPGPTGGGTATFSSVFGGTNPNGNWNLYVVDFVGGDSGSISGGWSLTINAGPTITPQHVLDYDGDGKTDPTVVRNTGGGSGGQVTWFIQNSGGAPASTTTPWGISTDFFVSGDFDGDNKSDICVYRPSAPFNSYFYILQSSTNTLRFDQFGQTGDDPTVVGDYDGDGKDDPAVFRGGASAGMPSFWYYRSSVNGQIIGTQWGQNGDFPAPGDYDGDGKNDFVIQRNNGSGQGLFFFNNSTSSPAPILFGTSSDLILPGDYDGDLKTDLAVARGSGGQILWSVRSSSTGTFTTQPWGLSASDFPAQGDYDGDGKTDIAIWRPNADTSLNFYHILRSSNGAAQVIEWGQQGDYPVANYNSH
jgi:subtilisin-like proprotein convertase family protein